jgi:hypothetical protein
MWQPRSGAKSRNTGRRPADLAGRTPLSLRPSYDYFLETPEQPVGPEHPAWATPLPVSRLAAGQPRPSACTYGDYFQGVRTFLEGCGREGLARGLRRRGLPPDPDEFRIYLAKHGEHYHPARVEANAAGVRGEWVVNVALSVSSRALLAREQALLERLSRETQTAFLPEVYGWGEVECRPGVWMGLLLAEWFSGFHEFHLTRLPDGSRGVVLWDTGGGNRRLPASSVAAVYRQAAHILTAYLNLDTFEAIASWHHAAGDFIVRDEPGGLELRLVTAREYRPLFANPPEDFESLLNACLVFLLQLSLRTRLDRLDGTGDMAWSGPEAVGATVDGVLAALAAKPFPEGLPIPFPNLFKRYLAGCPADMLGDLCADVIARSFPPGSAERALADAGLNEHVQLLSAAFDRHCPPQHTVVLEHTATTWAICANAHYFSIHGALFC